MNKPLLPPPPRSNPVRHRTSETSAGRFLLRLPPPYWCQRPDLWPQASGRSPPRPPLGSSSTRAPAQEPLTLQQLRAVERGRGRGARTPSQIPGGVGKMLFFAPIANPGNRVSAVAAGIAFYSLVACSGHRCGRVVLRAVRQRGNDEQPDGCPIYPCGLARSVECRDHPHCREEEAGQGSIGREDSPRGGLREPCAGNRADKPHRRELARDRTSNGGLYWTRGMACSINRVLKALKYLCALGRILV